MRRPRAREQLKEKWGARGHLEPVQLVVQSRFQAEQRLLLLAQLLQPGQHLDSTRKRPAGSLDDDATSALPEAEKRSGRGGRHSGAAQPLPTGACARFPFVNVNSRIAKLGCKSKTSNSGNENSLEQRVLAM